MGQPKAVNDKLSVASALIAKAQGTSIPVEQESLAMGAYAVLAAFLNSIEPMVPPGDRKRERRLLNDRRAGGHTRSDEPRTIDLRSEKVKSAYANVTPRPTGVGRQVNVRV